MQIIKNKKALLISVLINLVLITGMVLVYDKYSDMNKMNECLMKERRSMFSTQKITFRLFNDSGKSISQIDIKNSWKDFSGKWVEEIENQKEKVVQFEARYPLNLTFEGTFLDGSAFHYDFKDRVLQKNDMTISIDANGQFHYR